MPKDVARRRRIGICSYRRNAHEYVTDCHADIKDDVRTGILEERTN